jgi:hypothetical protein
LPDLVKPTTNAQKNCDNQSVKVSNDYKNHVKALLEAVSTGSWVWTPTPVCTIHDKWDIGDFWALKIKNPPEDVAWAKLLRETAVQKEKLVKEHWRTGLTWNSKVWIFYPFNNHHYLRVFL